MATWTIGYNCITSCLMFGAIILQLLLLIVITFGCEGILLNVCIILQFLLCFLKSLQNRLYGIWYDMLVFFNILIYILLHFLLHCLTPLQNWLCSIWRMFCLLQNVYIILQFLLHYLKSLQNWFPQEEWEQFPIASTSWALLRDSYHGDLCLSFAPEHIAVSVLYLALLSYGVEVPYNKYAETAWWKVYIWTL